MKILATNNYTSNNINQYKSNFLYNNSKVNFTGFFNLFKKDDSFMPSCSIIEDEDIYVGDLTQHLSKMKLSQNKLRKAYTKIYNSLKNQDERKVFIDHFGEYLIFDKSQQSTQLKPQKTTTSAKRPTSQVTTIKTESKQVTASKQETVANTANKTITEESLLKEFDLLEKEDIPQFVSNVAKASRETQYNLLEIYKELSEKHDKLMESDPSTKFQKDIRKKYTEQLKKEIREEFDKSGKDYESTDVIKETYKRLDKMAQEAGFDNYAPSTLKLGQKLAVLQKQMEEQNISFVPRIPQRFASEDDRYKFINLSIAQIGKNQASTFDALDILEKYGEQRYTQNGEELINLKDIATDINIYVDNILKKGCIGTMQHNAASIDLANKVIQRYLEVFSKFASTEVKFSPDVRAIKTIIYKQDSILNKDTLMMLINETERFAVDKKEYKSIKALINHYELQLYEGIQPEDIPELENAVNKLAQKVKNLPDDYLKP